MIKDSFPKLAIVLRALFLSALLTAINLAFDLALNQVILVTSAILGVISGGILAYSRINLIGLLALVIALLAINMGTSAILALFAPDNLNALFIPYIISHSLSLFIGIFAIAIFCTALSFRYSGFRTFEFLLTLLLGVSLFAAHRGFKLSQPKILDSASWFLGTSSINTILYIAFAVFILLAIHALCIANPEKLPGKRTILNRNKLFSWRNLFFSSLLVIICLFQFRFISQYYTKASVGITSNGVGDENREGLSPLTFHSALGSTNQPAAIVRLENDYKENPFSPMLFIRESALSEFNGREFVRASNQYDRDAPILAPGASFNLKDNLPLKNRIELVQSAFLLVDHKNLFAVDYPISVRSLQNPNPSRFKGAFRGYSLAPAIKLDEIAFANVGDHRWDEKTRRHYTAEHSDPRYRQMALKITANIYNPIQQLFKITEFLTKNAIYTLSPGHEVKENEDQVAPFLFGDLRGYCVHFAHAVAIMARSLGLPSRVASGYLTDLSQARDGHILLRMSDRHAWAETYIDGFGWIPLDVQPEQVESHADTQVDQKLLEELMGMLGPGEEILPEKLAEGESGLREKSDYLIRVSWLKPLTYFLLTTFFLIFIFGKFWLRFSYLLPASQLTKARRAYRAELALLFDLGAPRKFGETREEFRKRALKIFGTNLLQATSLLNEIKYGQRKSADNFTEKYLRPSLIAKNIGWRKKIIAFFNPSAVTFWLGGGRW